MALTKQQDLDLLDEVLYLAEPQQNEPTDPDIYLDKLITRAAKTLKLQLTPEDRRVVAALAYEQLTAEGMLGYYHPDVVARRLNS